MNSTDNGLYFEIKNGQMISFISGDIDHHRAKILRELMDKRLYNDRPEMFMINMSEVDFMDSSGLGLILGRFALCRELGIQFKLVSPSAQVTKILDLAGTGRLITIEKSSSDKISKL